MVKLQFPVSLLLPTSQLCFSGLELGTSPRYTPSSAWVGLGDLVPLLGGGGVTVARALVSSRDGPLPGRGQLSFTPSVTRLPFEAAHPIRAVAKLHAPAACHGPQEPPFPL